MKNIIPVALLTASTLIGCNNHSTQGISASKTEIELRTVLDLPRPAKGTTNDSDTLTAAEADSIYRQEFIEPGPH